MRLKTAFGLLLWAVAVRAQGQGVQRATLRVEVVKRGDITASVRGKAKLRSRKEAEVTLPDFLVKYVQPGQHVFLESPPVIFNGKVRSMGDKIVVDILSNFPRSILPGAEVSAVIETGKLKDVVYTARPFGCRPESEGALFRLEPSGDAATRVKVRYGKYGNLPTAVVEIVEGLRPGDRVIISDMSPYVEQESVRIQ